MSTATKPKHRLIRTPLKVVAEILLAIAFVVPIYLFVKASGPQLPGRNAPPRVENVASVAIPNYRDAVPVLIYHDIADRPGHFVVTPEHFAEQMAALHAQGFHAISVKQLTDFYHGGLLPDKPVLITFDDGLGSFWRTADPILKQYGFHGVAFVISGQVGKHGFYYMHPSEVRAMVQSGRWDVEAHTHMSHNYIPIDGHGHYGPALANRMWLPSQGRVETIQEYAARITNDLNLNIAELRSYGAHPLAFAYPFSAAGAPSNDRAHLFTILNHIIEQRFLTSFVDNAGQRFITRYDRHDPQVLPRLEVYQESTATRLLDRLRVLVPIAPRIDGFPHSGWYDEGGNRGLRVQPVAHGVLTLNKRHQHWDATYWSPSNTELWKSYRVAFTARGLGSDGKRASAGSLRIGSAGGHGYAVTVSSGYVSVQPQTGGRRPLYFGALPYPGSSHRVEVALSHGTLQVAVDGQHMKTLPANSQTHGGIGFGTWRPTYQSSIPRFDDLQVRPG
jgi:peptidoglycan/xylan/chitin deacetylase (PgdA/CDA1 family)